MNILEIDHNPIYGVVIRFGVCFSSFSTREMSRTYPRLMCSYSFHISLCVGPNQVLPNQKIVRLFVHEIALSNVTLVLFTTCRFLCTHEKSVNKKKKNVLDRWNLEEFLYLLLFEYCY